MHPPRRSAYLSEWQHAADRSTMGLAGCRPGGDFMEVKRPSKKKAPTNARVARATARPSSAPQSVDASVRSEIVASQPAASGFPIVGIGASAGGLAAFEAFFSAMPPNTESGIAIVVVQHLSPDHKSILVDLVKRYTRMRVFEVEDGMRVQPNCAYIIPPNRNMSLTDSVLSLTAP